MVGDVDVADYKAFVTDFSSFVFDFAYLNRPIMYFVPDYPQFKSGMNRTVILISRLKTLSVICLRMLTKLPNVFAELLTSILFPKNPFRERMKNFILI